MKFLEIQQVFSIWILPSIALKHWNFLDNLDFKGKIVAKCLFSSHFLPICNSMTVKQHFNHGAIQKLCHLHNGVFHFIRLCHTFLILTLSPLLSYSPKITNYGVREKKIFCMYGCFNVSRYIKGGKKSCR